MDAIAAEVAACTRDTPRCDGARKYENELRKCCRGHVITIMQTLIPLFDAARVRWWADYGMLLGAVRNPLTKWSDYPWLSQKGRSTPGPHAGIIPHDKDGDLGILAADLPKLRRIKAYLLRQGFDVVEKAGSSNFKVRLSRRNHTNVDIFHWGEREDGTLFRRRYISADEFKGREFPKSFIEPMGKVVWEGLTLNAPNNPKKFLEMRYGPNWMTPVCANHDGVRR